MRENPDLWSEVHHRLITAIAIALSSNLSLRYRVAIEKRTYLNDGSDIPKTDYRILICPGNRRPNAQLYAFNIRQEIPKFLLPLQPGDTEPLVDLQSLLVEVYEQARFDMAIDYRREPVPALKEEDRIWADALLREKELR